MTDSDLNRDDLNRDDLNRDDLNRDDLNRDDLNRDRTWLITGAGRGIGRALTEAALVAGERVIATVRDPDVLAQLTIRHRDRLQVGLLDVPSGVDRFQRLDVVVNNAGYGLVGAIEEIDEGAARAIVDTNTFAALWVTQAALPHLRRQGCQHPTRRMGHFRVPTSVVASRNGASSSTGAPYGVERPAGPEPSPTRATYPHIGRLGSSRCR